MASTPTATSTSPLPWTTSAGCWGPRSSRLPRRGTGRCWGWLAGFGAVGAVGVEGTGSYGAALARHLAESGVRVIEVGRPNRQVRRRHGKTDVVDAIAAARAVQSGDATAIPKSHDGPVEALRALKMVQRSARKARTQALNQLHALVLTAPEELRGKLRGLKNRDLVATCAAFRVRPEDDSLTAIIRLSLRELAQRIRCSRTRTEIVATRMRRITTNLAPALVAKTGVGPDTATTLLITAGDNPDRLAHEKSFAALVGAAPIPRQLRPDPRPSPTQPRRRPRSQLRTLAHRHRPDGHRPRRPATTSPTPNPKARPRAKPSAASSATSPARSSTPYPQQAFA